MGAYPSQVQVHAEPVKRRYVADCCSLACALNLLIVAGAAILPLYVAQASRLWRFQEVLYEQLDLEFQSALVLQVQGLAPPVNGFRAPFTAMWTTSPAANDMLGSGVVRGTIVRTSFEDTNRDGVGDIFRASASMPLLPGESVLSATLVAYFDVRLHNVTRLFMDGLISVGGTGGGVPGARLVLDGDITIAQHSTLPATPEGVYAPFLASPLPPLSAALSARAATPEGILEGVYARNYTLRYTQCAGAQPVWLPDPWVPSAVDVSALATQPRSFELSLTARVPRSAVLIKPSVAQELKWGWVQYVALLTVSAAVAWVLQRVLFGLRIVETTVLVDVPTGGTKLHLS